MEYPGVLHSMELDLATRSRAFKSMEAASRLQALAPNNEAGIQIGQSSIAVQILIGIDF
jgi:hypothetical protein